MKQWNVHIKDKHFHEIHHALGRPWPEEIMGETYRNYFAIDSASETADRMRASPHWFSGPQRKGMIYFYVTDEGKRALLDYIKQHVEVPARYALTFHGYDHTAIVSAKSRSAAKYAAYLDADTGWTFPMFVSTIKSVRLHSQAHIPAQAN